MKRSKRIISTILCISLFLGLLTVPSVGAANIPEGTFAGFGKYTAHLMADPTTADAPEEFGTVAANGKVWVDKSVTVDQDHFEVTLSALAQEYISEKEGTVQSGTAADVVMLLDLSGSMSNTLTFDGVSMTRTKAMIMAVNEAVDIIMNANENNRILIYTYQGSGSSNTASVKELLPLGHYTNPSWSNTEIWSGNSGKFFNYTNDAIQTSRNLKKDGASFSQKSYSTGSGTYTQYGLYKSIDSLISSINKETKTTERNPYVLLFTDGAPGCAHTTWYNISSATCNLNHNNDGTAQITALTLLTAALMKDRLQSAYTTYNGKQTPVEWFNIGLGVDDNKNGTLFLNPSDIATDTSSTAASIRGHLDTYTSGRYSSYSALRENYVYTNRSYLTNTGDTLKEAFKSLAGKVEEETKTITFPILSVEGTAEDLIFTDVIGAGMKVDGLTLYPTATTPVQGIASGNVYTFSGYDMTATLSTDAQGRQVLTWKIPADEIAIYSFADRQNPTNGQYIAAQPLRLCYKTVIADPESYNGTVLHPSAETKAQFTLAPNNSYYYDDTLLSAPFAAQAKTKNTSNTAANVISFTTGGNNATTVTADLGNNGIILPATQLQKLADSTNANPNTEMGYTLKIKNVGNETLYNVQVEDTLPAELTYKEGSATIAPQVEGRKLIFTLPEIKAGETLELHYFTRIAPEAANLRQLTNTACVSEIHTIEVYHPSESSAVITVLRLYNVRYQWSGEVPEGVILPTNAGRYPTGGAYTLDRQFTNQTKVENKDAFGNVTERWTFSGWTDPQGGIMGEEDVTVRGVWNYESFQIPTHKVLYTWSGDIPAGKVLPTDQTAYVYNQPYTVDSTFTAQTILPTYDAYNNINGRYTFSGWADPQGGRMGNEDVTVAGVWHYEAVTVSQYRVLYAWSGQIPQGVTLPTDQNAYYPNQSYAMNTAYTDQTVINDYDAYGNLCGRWTFSGWNDPQGGTMGHADVTVSGVWEYSPIPVPEHKVLYLWSGEVPAGQTLPTDQNTYAPNQPYTVNTSFTRQTVIPTYDQFGNLNGRYTFSGWEDPQSGVMGNTDVTIEGVWEYTPIPVPDYSVIYRWSGEVPAGQALPVDANRYRPNQPYTVNATHTAQTVIADFDAFGNLCGNYFFRGWQDPNQGVMGNANVTIEGVWEYEPVSVPTYQVVYRWSGEIPANLTLPTDGNRYRPHQTYAVDVTHTNQTEVPTYDQFGNLNGRYTFSGWTDPNQGTMGNADVTIEGVWKYEPVSVPDYQVVYRWSGEIPAGQTLPTDGNRYVTNQPYTVDQTYTKSTEFSTYDQFGNLNGRYTFSGWTDPNQGTMGNANVTIEGVWKYEPVSVPTYQVVYVWSGEIPAGQTLPTDDHRYIPGQEYSIDTTYTDQTEIPTYDQFGNLNGRYTFSGWTDPNEGLMGNADITVGGVWSYESLTVDTHKVIYIWSGEVPEGAILPTDENTYVPNQPYQVDTSFPAQMAVEKRNEQDQLLGVYTFHGWTDPNEGTMGNEDVTIAGIWTYEAFPQEEPTPLPPAPEGPDLPTPPASEEPSLNTPNTGEAIPVNLFLILWAISALALILLGIFKKKFKTN